MNNLYIFVTDAKASSGTWKTCIRRNSSQPWMSSSMDGMFKLRLRIICHRFYILWKNVTGLLLNQAICASTICSKTTRSPTTWESTRAISRTSLGRNSSRSQTKVFCETSCPAQHLKIGKEILVYIKLNLLKTRFFFLVRSKNKYHVVMAPCMAKPKETNLFQITRSGMIRQPTLNMCLDHRNLDAQNFIFATQCDATSETQKWSFVNTLASSSSLDNEVKR